MTTHVPTEAQTASDESLKEVRSAPLPHLPALDGVRGLAVIGVLLFHGGFSWAKGGFLGVSTFFTLSGFLITNILVREWERTGTVDLLRFWGRRLRRLLPAAVVTIALIGLVWWRVGTAEQLSSLRGDMISSLAYVANWRLWSAGVSYGSLFSDPSPFQHFWSLAIEEQFYVLFPLIVLGVTRLGGRKLLFTTCAVATASSIFLMWLQRSDFDRIYYGTDTRVAELLFGVLLALWWSSRQRVTSTSKTSETAFTAVGLIATMSILFSWVTVGEGSSLLALGGFPLYAAASTLLIYTATRAGLVAKVFSNRTLRWAGLLSYGLYLYHWPIFLFLSPDRTGLSTLPLFAVRMAVTLALAVVSYRLLEMPIRKATLLHSTRAAIAAAVGGAVSVTALAFLITLAIPTSTIPFASLEVGDDLTTIRQVPGQVPNSDETARTVYIFGDSGALDLQPALGAAVISTGTTKIIDGAGPGFGLAGTIPWRSMFSTIVAEESPDLVFAMLGGWDIDFIKNNGIGAYSQILDEAVSILTAKGARIVWVPILPGGKGDMTALNELIRSLDKRYPDSVMVPQIDSALAGPNGSFPRSINLADDSTLLLRKPDGWHLCQDGAARLATILVEQVVRRGWSSPMVSEWLTGPWRESPVYDDPAGACDLPLSGNSKSPRK
ncbi:MAG: acyltransferase family protein [Acidimicrobiales bacterium]